MLEIQDPEFLKMIAKWVNTFCHSNQSSGAQSACSDSSHAQTAPHKNSVAPPLSEDRESTELTVEGHHVSHYFFLVIELRVEE